MSRHVGMKTFCAAMLASTALVVFSGAQGVQAQAIETMDVGPHNSTFSGNVRGYWFTAPRDFYIVGVDVPTEASTANFNAVIIRFPAPPPS